MEDLLLTVVFTLLLLLIIAVSTVAFLIYQYFSLKSQMQLRIQQQFEAWRERELAPVIREQSETARREAQELLHTWREQELVQFQQWREQELGLARQQQLEMARSEAAVQLEQWKSEHEQFIRQDAIQRSQSVTVGKVTEHFVPYLPDFIYNPKDARFIGSPIDLVVFDGLNEGEIREIIFVEIKTGASTLTARERRVRDAVQAGRVKWLELRPILESDIVEQEES